MWKLGTTNKYCLMSLPLGQINGCSGGLMERPRGANTKPPKEIHAAQTCCRVWGRSENPTEQWLKAMLLSALVQRHRLRAGP
jgi:hypothetical protein